MSFFRKKEDPNKTIENLNKTLEQQQKRELFLQKEIEKQLELAKSYNQKKNKNAALACLKKKKNLEKQLEGVRGQMANIETMKGQIEESTMNIESIKAQKAAAKTLQNVLKTATPEKVDKVMDKVRDAMDDAKEVSEALSQSLGTEAIDEGELEDELNQLEAEDLGDKLPEIKGGKNKIKKKL
jgi:charged multivesicular body protein 4